MSLSYLKFEVYLVYFEVTPNFIGNVTGNLSISTLYNFIFSVAF